MSHNIVLLSKKRNMKSSIHHEAIDINAIGAYILKIENTFPLITIKRFIPNADTSFINDKLIANLSENHPSYLSNYSKETLESFLDQLKTEIHPKRGN